MEKLVKAYCLDSSALKCARSSGALAKRIRSRTPEEGIYGSKEFQKIVIYKLHIISSELKHGKPILFLDTDVVVLKDPTDYLDALDKDYDIYFSKVAGEYSTLKMIGEHMEVFGEHSGDYLDFFTLSQNY